MYKILWLKYINTLLQYATYAKNLAVIETYTFSKAFQNVECGWEDFIPIFHKQGEQQQHFSVISSMPT